MGVPTPKQGRGVSLHCLAPAATRLKREWSDLVVLMDAMLGGGILWGRSQSSTGPRRFKSGKAFPKKCREWKGLQQTRIMKEKRFAQWRAWLGTKRRMVGSWLDSWDGDCPLFQLYREDPPMFTGIDYFE